MIGETVSGLYLVQFTGPVEPEWREALSALGVQLIRYVPEDTFIARFTDVSAGLIQAKPYVFWVGAFNPVYKVGASLVDQLINHTGQSALTARIMLAPTATLQDRAELYKRLRSVRGLSRSRFAEVLQVQVEPQELGALLSSPAVLWVEGAANMKLSDEVASKIVGGGFVSVFNQTHASDVQAAGFDGNGVTVAVADSGLNNGRASDMHPDLYGRVTDFFYYGNLFDASDEHAHGTHVTGIIAGDGAGNEFDENGAAYGLGVAPSARIVAQRIFDGVGGYEAPDSFEQLTRDAVRAGAIIGSNSWGDDARGRYDISAAEFDALVRDADFETPGDQQYILEFSAGNAGPAAGSINSPAVAKNVIATGASQNDRPDFFIYADGTEAMADFSSRGPCEDGRIKPDIVAPGTWISSAQSFSATAENAWAEISPLYQYQGGTSQSGPHASGAAAVFVQWYRELHEGVTPSPAMVKAALINSAWDLADDFGTTATPNNDEGWGRIDLPNLVLGFTRREFVDQSVLLMTSQVYEQRAVVLSGNEPLVISLTYTDVPGLPLSIPALVNDLDLEVISPAGKVYRGNQFDPFGISVPEAQSADAINNVEGIYIDDPLRGEWIIRVIARNVAEDARIDTLEVDQDFALVFSADLPSPDASVLLMDRTAYRAPSEIKFRLIDYDLTSESAASINLSSGTELAGFTVTLNNIGVPGVFTGTVATAVAPAVAGDGVLQIADSEIIIGEYFDASRNSFTISTAFADFQSPAFGAIYLTNRFGRTFVVVHSNERVNATIHFGTNQPPESAAMSQSSLVTHEIELRGLIPGEIYNVSIDLEDIAGNASFYDNSGNYLQFVAPEPATVLLVNDYTQYPIGSESEPIPLSEYTQTLQDIGVTFEVWDVEEREGSPGLDYLSTFAVVIWRINDDFWATGVDDLDPTERISIESYINGGGGFFMSSMEIISRLGDVPFRTNVLNVAKFVPNPDPFGDACDSCDEDFGVPFIVGEPSDEVSRDVVAELDYSAFPVWSIDIINFSVGPDLSDTFTPSPTAATTFYDINDKPCGIHYPRIGADSPGRVVFMSFPLEAIPADGTESGRAAILDNALRFLVPGLNGRGTISFDSSEYTIPDEIIVEVADSDLKGLGTTTITMFSQTLPGGVDLALVETVTPGLFRGKLRLVSATTPPASGILPTAQGESIFARYLDVSERLVRQASADIDTIPPVISNLALDVGYIQTVIEWDTDEYTDATVEFGESPFFEGVTHRTVDERPLGTFHSLTLYQLRPRKQYFYKVISRDHAGNVTVLTTEPGGQPLSFTTLDPLTPPWLDDMEIPGLNDWSVFSSDLTEVQWEQGPPGYIGATPHSGANVWGSNLGGGIIGQVETFLLSPPIDLDPALGNRATLRMWQDYDFIPSSELSIIEGGELMVITNTATAPVSLASYSLDSSFGWEEVEFDLSPFIGQAVYLVWYYVDFSVGEYDRRRGWMIDDVSVTMQQIDPGTLSISNNVAQATFSISGPISRSRQPWYYQDDNAPPGEYVVSFNAVPYYQTPAPITGVLESGSTLDITGNYMITDSNTNGIADSWETQFLGGVNPNLTSDSDTDGDGMPDALEFLVGTNPTNSASLLKLDSPMMSSNNVVEIKWPTAAGRAYQLQSSTNIIDWKTLIDWYRSTGAVGVHQQVAPNSGSVIFRLRVKP